MADPDETQDKPKRQAAAAKTEAQAPDGNGGDAIPIDQLAEHGSALLGYQSHVVAGALYGHDPTETMTVDDAKSLIEDWLQQKVQVDQGEGD